MSNKVILIGCLLVSLLITSVIVITNSYDYTLLSIFGIIALLSLVSLGILVAYQIGKISPKIFRYIISYRRYGDEKLDKQLISIFQLDHHDLVDLSLQWKDAHNDLINTLKKYPIMTERIIADSRTFVIEMGLIYTASKDEGLSMLRNTGKVDPE